MKNKPSFRESVLFFDSLFLKFAKVIGVYKVLDWILIKVKKGGIR